MDAALGAIPPLRLAEWKVFNAVLHQTTTWSRHDDVLSVATIGQVARLSDRHVRAALVSLRERGMIIYEAQRGRPRAGERGRCRIGIPLVADGPPSASSEIRPSGGMDNRGVHVDNPAPRPAANPPEIRPPAGPTPEEVQTENHHHPDTDPAELAVLALLAERFPLTDTERAELAALLTPLLDEEAWSPTRLAGHLLADLPTTPIRRRYGFLRYRIAQTPKNPGYCGCTHCDDRDALIARARQIGPAPWQPPAQPSTPRDRHDQITEALGHNLYTRIRAAEEANYPGNITRTPALLRGLVTAAYARHDYDIDRLRTWAEALPAPSHLDRPQTSASAHLHSSTADEMTFPLPSRSSYVEVRKGAGGVQSAAARNKQDDQDDGED